MEREIPLGPATGAILESISDGVFTVDHEWRITSFNRAAEVITGIPRDEALGRLCSEVFKASCCESGCVIRETLTGGVPVINRPIYFIDAFGERVPVSVSTAVLRDAAGKVIGGAETFRDLSELESLREASSEGGSLGGFVSGSNAMRPVLELSRAVADTPSTVLVQGETGSGKEVLARAIHQHSTRREEPFAVINCAALPDSLLESELFGYKRGAFTGAERDKPGRFALAGRGTLFLDEIGEVSPALQVRLLRVLQERVYEPLGGTESIPLQARIIAATHRNLEMMVEEGSFRQDLYYRVNVMTLHLPPLRERREDIPLLADHFLQRINIQQERELPGFTPEAYALLLEHDWPGNVRELANVIERSAILCGTGLISPAHFPGGLTGRAHVADDDYEGALARSERGIILAALEASDFHIPTAAQKLGMHRATLYRKLHRLNIELPRG